MIRPLKALLLTTTLIAAIGKGVQAAQAPAQPQQPTKTLKAVPNFVTATDAMMRAPKPEDWIIHRGNYQSWGYSSLQQINKGNVKSLQLAWSRAMAPGINQATPLVYNGIMYLGNPGDVIQAIDAANGDLLWEYKHPLPPPAAEGAGGGWCCGPMWWSATGRTGRSCPGMRSSASWPTRPPPVGHTNRLS